jgi:hypothetical protein
VGGQEDDRSLTGELLDLPELLDGLPRTAVDPVGLLGIEQLLVVGDVAAQEVGGLVGDAGEPEERIDASAVASRRT